MPSNNVSELPAGKSGSYPGGILSLGYLDASNVMLFLTWENYINGNGNVDEAKTPTHTAFTLSAYCRDTKQSLLLICYCSPTHIMQMQARGHVQNAVDKGSMIYDYK